MAAPIIAPSVLSADFANLQTEIEMLNSSKADLIHIDIMDGQFVPNISFGFPVCQAINRYATKPLDFHLMIQDANLYLEDCINTGAETISVHIEACSHLHRTISEIKRLGAKAGVAINPHTSVAHLSEILPYIDVVLVMSVNPGFGGQKFIETTIDKIRKIKALINHINPSVLIQIDGGVTTSNAKTIINAGADILIAGSFVFNSDDPIKTIEDLKAI